MNNEENARSYKKHILVSGLLMVVVIVFIALLSKGLTIDPTKIPSELIGKQAYPFSAAWIQGKELLPQSSEVGFQLSDFQGQTIILNFWASWCVSCRQEAKELEAFWKKYGSSDIKVIGIAIQDTTDAAKQFAQFYGKTYILGLDIDGKIGIDYGVTGVPETFMIDRSGKVIHKEVGPVTVHMLEQYLPKLQARG